MDLISPALTPGELRTLLAWSVADSPAPALTSSAPSLRDEMLRSLATPRLIQVPDYLPPDRQVAQPSTFPQAYRRVSSGAWPGRKPTFRTIAVCPNYVEIWSGGKRDE